MRLAVAATVVFAIVAWAGLSPATGGLLALLAIGAVVVLLRWAGHGRDERQLAGEVMQFADGVPPGDDSRLPGWVDPIRVVLALAGVLAGAQILVTNAVALANGSVCHHSSSD